MLLERGIGLPICWREFTVRGVRMRLYAGMHIVVALIEGDAAGEHSTYARFSTMLRALGFRIIRRSACLLHHHLRLIPPITGRRVSIFLFLRAFLPTSARDTRHEL